MNGSMYNRIEKERPLKWDFDMLVETFVSEQYKWLAENLVPDTVAIDIGAYIGDSSIYLAQQSKIIKVLAYEAHPRIWERGTKLMSFVQKSTKNKIYYKMGAMVGSKIKSSVDNIDGVKTTKSGPIFQATPNFIYLNKSSKKRNIPIYHLYRILDKLSKNPIAIKCDVEGDEYNIFMDDKLDLYKYKNVYIMQIEYHMKKTLKDLSKCIRGYGFKVKSEKLQENTPRGHDQIGWLYAYRDI